MSYPVGSHTLSYGGGYTKTGLKTLGIYTDTMKRIIMKVWKNKANGQLLVTIPAGSGIEEGEYIEIKKVK